MTPYLLQTAHRLLAPKGPHSIDRDGARTLRLLDADLASWLGDTPRTAAAIQLFHHRVACISRDAPQDDVAPLAQDAISALLTDHAADVPKSTAGDEEFVQHADGEESFPMLWQRIAPLNAEAEAKLHIQIAVLLRELRPPMLEVTPHPCDRDEKNAVR